MSEPISAHAEITEVVKTYVEGMVWGDADRLRAAFHAKASCIGHFEGGLEWDDLTALIDVFTADDAAPGLTPYWKINSVQVIADMGVVYVENNRAGVRYDDVLTLLHHDGRWQIVSKVFYARPG